MSLYRKLLNIKEEIIMLGELLIFAVVLVALDIGVKLLIARFVVNKTKSKVKRITSFRLADWHLKQYNKLIKK